MGSPDLKRRVWNRHPLTTAVVALSLISAPAVLASTVSLDGSANILSTLTVQFTQHLTFGTIAPSTTSNSTVNVLRGSNNSSICGPGLTCFEPGNRARIIVSGAPGQLFSISDPGSTQLTDGNGNAMQVDMFVGAGSRNDTSFGAVRRLRANGTRNMNIGATLYVAANQPPGLYTGTYTITASYE